MQATENKKTYRKPSTMSLRGTYRNLPPSSWATWLYELLATPLLGSENSHKDPTLPAAATDSMLAEDLLLHLHLACLCRSTFSVLSETICWKDVGKATSPGTFHLTPMSVNSDSYDNFTIPYNSDGSPEVKWSNWQQRQIHTGENKKTFNHFSLRGTLWNLPSSSWATWHYELFATPLLESENSRLKATLPAVSTGSTLQVNLRLHLHLSCFGRSTCSVLSKKSVERMLGRWEVQVYNPS